MRISDWSSDVCSSDLRHQLRSELRLDAGGFSVTPSVEWIPQGAWADYANTTRAGGYAVANLGATATLNERASVFLDARNLFDRRGVADISAATLVTPDRKSTRLNSSH